MESYLIYIGKSALATGGFYLVYLLLFQNQKQFVFNRFYLPVSLALSFIIPLITFTSVNYIEQTASSNLDSFVYLANTISGVSLPEFTLQWYHYLTGLYILTGAGFLFYLLIGHLKAMSIIRYSRLKNLFGNQVNITPKDIHPFSFFNKIVISENTLDHPNLDMIVSHESIHVKERHTLDILFVEILFLFQWFNPFAWLIKDAVKNNLEYKTDHQITKTYNPKNYQLAMVALADKQGVAPFLTALNGSQLKNRIIMMKKKTENKYALLKQLIVLPLLAILVMGLANREIKTEFIETEKQVEISQSDNDIVQIESDTIKSVPNTKTGENKVQYYGTQIKPNTVDSHVKASKTVYLNWKTDKTTPLYIVDGKEIENIESINPDDIKSIDVLKNKSSTDIYGEKGKNGVILISTKNALSKSISYDSKIYEGKFGEMSVLNYSRSHTVDEKGELRFNVEEMPQFPGGELALRKYIENSVRYPETAKENGIHGKVYVTFIINKTGNVTDARISRGVDPLLNKEALRVINSLPLWKPGKQGGKPVDVSYTVPVLFGVQDEVQVNKKPKITYLPNKNSSSSAMLTGSNDSILYIVDDKEIDIKSLSEIQPETIESVSIIKDASAVDIYGEKAKNGVIIITLKDSKKETDVTKITTQLELRRFIAKEIKYPEEARSSNEVVITTLVEFDKDGNLLKIEELSKKKYIGLDEIVIVGYKNENDKPSPSNAEKGRLLGDETTRVVNKLPKIDIPEFKGQQVAITVRFILQD